MNIEFLTRNFEATDEERDYARKKLAKVRKFVQEPVETRVTLEVEKHRHIAEIHLAHRFGILQATEETGEMKDAINLAVDKIEKQARRSKKKHKAKRRRADRRNGGHSWPLEVLEAESLGASEGPKIVHSTKLAIKPMSLEEAALNLDDSDYGFIVFRDSSNDRVSVLYKRHDEDYGLISPEL